MVRALAASGERLRLSDATVLLDDLVLGDFEDFLTVAGGRLLDEALAQLEGREHESISRS